MLLQATSGPAAEPAAPTPDAQHISTAITRAENWLLKQQSPDGGWHSEVYGVLKSGQGTTALALYALATRREQPPSPGVQTALKQGCSYLMSSTVPGQLITGTGTVTDQPMYATALVVMAAPALPDLSPQQVKDLCSALVQAQRLPGDSPGGDSVDDSVDDTVEVPATRSRHSSEGGWGPDSGELDTFAPRVPANISVTAHVLEALQGQGQLNPLVRDMAQRFVRRCMSRLDDPDPGFFFTPRPEDPLNKAGLVQTESGTFVARPYHSTTCDGLLALHILGTIPDRFRLGTALAHTPAPRLWRTLPTTDEVVPQLDGLFFYDAAATARLASTLPEQVPAELRNRLLAELLDTQQADGSWTNPCPWMRENDPQVATSLALVALRRLPTASRVESRSSSPGR
jgi:hypothetical protein